MRLFVLAFSLVCWCSCQILVAEEAETVQETGQAEAGHSDTSDDSGQDHAGGDHDGAAHEDGDHAGGDHDGAAHEDGDHVSGDHDGGSHEADAGHSGHGNGDSHAHDDSATNPFVMDPDLAIATGIVFVLLFLVLSKFAWGPIVEALDNREQSVANKIDEANKNFAKAQEQLAIYEKKIAAAAEESRAMLETARKDAEAVAAKVRAEAEEDAKRQRERALADIEAAKNAALRDISEKSADIAVSLAGKIVRREVKSADHAELIRGALDKMPSSN